MNPGEEIRIDCFDDERFWYVDRTSQALIKYIDDRGEMFIGHRAFAMTLAEYERACDMRKRSKIYIYSGETPCITH